MHLHLTYERRRQQHGRSNYEASEAPAWCHATVSHLTSRLAPVAATCQHSNEHMLKVVVGESHPHAVNTHVQYRCRYTHFTQSSNRPHTQFSPAPPWCHRCWDAISRVTVNRGDTILASPLPLSAPPVCTTRVLCRCVLPVGVFWQYL